MNKLKHITTFILFAINFTSMAIAQSPVKDIGKVTAVTINTQSIDITTENAFATITVYSPDIVRVRIDKHKLQPVKTTVKIEQDANAINITTDSLKTIIQKNPFSIAFYTSAGTLISEDEQ